MIIINHLPIPKTFHLQWHITKKCNFRCKHCYNDDKTSENELSKEEIFNILDQYIELLIAWNMDSKKNYISWTGGEPLLRKDFYEILEKCKENSNFFRYSVMSNGSTINENVAMDLKYLGVNGVQISIDGMQETNDEIRGRGSFEKAVRAIEILKNAGLFVNVSLTLSKKNINEIEDLAKICEKSGANILSISRLLPMGRGKDMENMLISTKEFRKMIHCIDKMDFHLFRRNSNFRVYPGCGSPVWVADNIKFGENLNHRCSSGSDSLTIIENGDVFPCRRYPLLVGNLRNKSLFKIFYESEQLWQLRNVNNIHQKCRECKIYNECGGGSRCNSDAYFNNPFAPDPNCWETSEEMLPRDSFPRLPDSAKFELNKKYFKPITEKPDEIENENNNVFEITPENIEKIASEIAKMKNVLIAFNINSNNCSNAGVKIKDFLSKLENSKTDFKIVKPIPRCLFGFEYQKLASKYKFPESCSECWKFESCETLQKLGAEKWHRKYMNRKQQLEFLNNISKPGPGEKCSICMWRLRGNCDIPCF